MERVAPYENYWVGRVKAQNREERWANMRAKNMNRKQAEAGVIRTPVRER